jgi:hypothetical protein
VPTNHKTAWSHELFIERAQHTARALIWPLEGVDLGVKPLLGRRSDDAVDAMQPLGQRPEVFLYDWYQRNLTI